MTQILYVTYKKQAQIHAILLNSCVFYIRLQYTLLRGLVQESNHTSHIEVWIEMRRGVIEPP